MARPQTEPLSPAEQSIHPPDFPQSWACAWGEDQFGLWQSLEIDGLEQKMRWMPPGVFLMGDEIRGEKSAVSVSGFWLADTACSQSLYQTVMGKNPSTFSGDHHPVESVSFTDIVVFIQALNNKIQGFHARLPSEKEWEYACRAGTESAYWWGDEISPDQARYGWYANQVDELKGTVPVNEFEPNPWGVYQMSGNVWEWCDDWFDSDEDKRVLRGGSWINGARRARSAARGAVVPGLANDAFGFRLSRGQ